MISRLMDRYGWTNPKIREVVNLLTSAGKAADSGERFSLIIEGQVDERIERGSVGLKISPWT
jgi:hypothetical protein